MLKDKQPVQSSSEIVYTPFKTLEPESALKVDQELVAGDELSCPTGNVTIGLQSSAGNAFYDISAKFRIKILNSRRIYLFKGEGYVRANVPTEVMSGEIVMGNKSTEYAIRVTRSQQGPVQECLVYEGSVTLNPENSDSAGLFRARAEPKNFFLISFGSNLATGDKAVILPGGVLTKDRVSKEDIVKGATVFAQVDAAKATFRKSTRYGALQDLTVEGPPSFEEAYNVLYRRHLAVLSEPTNASNRLELGIAQINFHLPTDAIYELKKAERFSSTDDRRLRAVVAMVNGAAFSQAGLQLYAESAFDKATLLDPTVFDEQNLKKYGLAEDVKVTIKARNFRKAAPSQDRLKQTGPSSQGEPTKPVTLPSWPLPMKGSSDQRKVFQLLLDHRGDEALLDLQRRYQATKPLDSIDAYYLAIIFYERKDFPTARLYATRALELSKSDSLLSQEVSAAIRRLIEP